MKRIMILILLALALPAKALAAPVSPSVARHQILHHFYVAVPRSKVVSVRCHEDRFGDHCTLVDRFWTADRSLIGTERKFLWVSITRGHLTVKYLFSQVTVQIQWS